MSELLYDRQRSVLSELVRLIEEHRREEAELNATYVQDEEVAVEEVEKVRAEWLAGRQRETAELDAAFAKEQQELTGRGAEEERAAQRAVAENLQRLETEEKETHAKVEAQYKDAIWTADSLLEAGQRRVQEQLDNVKHKVSDSEKQGNALRTELLPLLERMELDWDDVEPNGEVPPLGTSLKDLQTILGAAETLVRAMQQLRLFRWISGRAFFLMTFCACLLASVPALFQPWLQRPWFLWLGGGLAAGVGAAYLTWKVFYLVTLRRIRRGGRKFAVLLVQAHDLGTLLTERTAAACEEELAQVRKKHAHDRRKVDNRYKPLLEQLARRYPFERETLLQKHQAAQQTHRQELKQALEMSHQRYEQARSHCLASYERRSQATESAHAERIHTLVETRSRTEQQRRSRWQANCIRLLGELTELKKAGGNPLIQAQPRPVPVPGQPWDIPPGLPFGTLTVDLGKMAGEMPLERLAPLPAEPLQVPAFLPFPRRCDVLLHAQNQGRASAIQSLQALMLRFLITLPPGKVRFTILDPVGLGDNFAAFMHLADHDEALVTSRIWTEPGHIEKQLADLTVHMENVIQKYLRSQFDSIEDYNAQAGEVAEPYRVLVVANFPANFTPDAARRLVSIVQSGSSCGVYALISVDTRQQMPQGFQLADLEQQCVNLHWQGDHFAWEDEALGGFPLNLDTPPAPNRLIEIMQEIGTRSRDANRVQVPFSFIAPSENQVWKGDSRKGIAVPLGRCGAVRRLQLQLGQGTSQHVLVAGKTGSGKSTLWHALITNLALHYSPDELELYLIDFKKGVEFKAYATHEIPHARVIAIESEREFGLSVLQRLDAELRERGDLFRSAGVNDIASYRQAKPEIKCPRILLIVDEFQEFFVEDDRLSQDAALLLDRLVRQGRAFGLHVLLGSQTLGGAYSLARSTLDQMAVRIALQCSEADAQMILNKDNSAARLLSRPGEAIYNDTNGSIEGNEVFQMVWLPEEQREQLLESLHRRAELSPPLLAHKPLVFEGNTLAQLERNPLLQRVLEGNDSEDIRGSRAWLGEAIAIKDPTAAVFRAQTSHNLLIVGQNEEMALALMASSLISLAVQHPADPAQGDGAEKRNVRRPAYLVVLDGTGVDDPQAGYLKRVAGNFPHSVQMVERAEVPPVLAGLAEEMNQRLKGTGTDRSLRFLLIHGLQRFREFRKAEDDFGFGRRGADKTVTPLEHLQALLRDGPSVGVHVLLWCDSLLNINRTLDRQGLRECGLRVLFQMSQADSSHLLDSPLASRLGRARALFFHDEMAQPEKFRPYGLPPLAWLEQVKNLARR